MFGFRRSALLNFFLGFVAGCILMYFNDRISRYASKFYEHVEHKVSDTQPFSAISHNDEIHHHEHDLKESQDEEGHQLLAFDHEHEEGQLAKRIKDNVRVFCWIMTSKKNTISKAVHINNTWASKCNKHVFITAESNSTLPSVDVGVKEGREHLWGKTKRAFQYIYKNELDNYDWFLKADDDTYVILENLRFMLLAYSPKEPIYFGCKFKPFVKQGYMSGGSGYVLSREAVRRFVAEAIPDSSRCKKSDSGAEDAEIGKCLANVGVVAGDSRDSNGRHRMLPFSPLSHFENNASMPGWFKKYMYYPYKQGSECCSDHMISFHYVNKALLYAIHNLIYHIRPFGLASSTINEKDNNAEPIDSLFESAKEMAKAESMVHG
ncbi:fringe-like domain-containing protein [Ditylenchus destructor]|nr:fringe-like domain-containing protein [Ditylenchus destructor]